MNVLPATSRKSSVVQEMETRNGKWWRTSFTKGRGAGRRVKLIGVPELAKHRSRTLLELLHMSFSWLRFAVEYSSRSLCFNSLVGVRAKMHNHVDEGVAAIAYAGTRINVNINSGHRPSACTITTP